MAKRKSKVVNGHGRTRKPVGHEGGKRVAALRGRVNTIPSNGDLPSSVEVAPEPLPVGEAMRRAVAELGDVTIDDDLAPSQLRQLAETYEEVVKAKAVHAQKADAAKVAKKALESITELLLEKVRSFTHPSALPLFDQAQAEQDRQDMLDAADSMTEA